MPCGTNQPGRPTDGSMNQAPPDMPMPTRRHRFDAAGDDDLVGALRDLGRAEIDRVEARRAEAGDLHAGRLGVVARLEGGRARDHRARLADRIDAAEDDVVDLAVSSPLRSRTASSTLAPSAPPAPRAANRPSCRGRAACARRHRHRLRPSFFSFSCLAALSPHFSVRTSATVVFSADLIRPPRPAQFRRCRHRIDTLLATCTSDKMPALPFRAPDRGCPR